MSMVAASYALLNDARLRRQELLDVQRALTVAASGVAAVVTRGGCPAIRCAAPRARGATAPGRPATAEAC